jgi:hypothetical protein
MPFDIGGYIYNNETLYTQDYKNIVTRGLLLHLDANVYESYPGTGTSWYDISGNDYVASMNVLTAANWVTISGTKAFETNDTNAQSFTVSDFAFPQNGRTYELWFRSKSFSIGWQTWFDDNGTEHILFGTSTNAMTAYPDYTVSPNLQVDTWYHLSYTLVGGAGSTVTMYLNGVSQGSGTYNTGLATGTGLLYIMGDQGSEISSGFCPIARVYNRVLTSTELLQNYNAQKARFGL